MHISLVLLIISLATPTICILGDIQLELIHVDYGRQLTRLELAKRAASRSQARAALLTSKPQPSNSNPLSKANIPFHPSGGGEYVLELAIGTPPRPYPFLLDTGSGLIWTQCKPCSRCLSQPSPIFDPFKSSTFSRLPCSNKLCEDLYQKNCTTHHGMYIYGYGDQTYTYGSFSSETFTFGTSSKIKAQIAFGCGNINGGDLNNSSGIAGFSMATTSMVSQLGISGFSYCMTDDINKRSLLRFGTQEEIYRDIKGPVQTSKFVNNPPAGYAQLYFIVMTGITVGTKRLSIPKSVFKNGTLVDSGTTYSQLPEVAYNKLKEALISVMKLPASNESVAGLDCFSLPSILPSRVKAPKVTLHFEGIDMNLARENYILDFDDDGVLCFSIGPTTDPFGTLGNKQQINMQVMYDLKNSNLAIAPNQCYKKQTHL